jgi:hypothetical protein
MIMIDFSKAISLDKEAVETLKFHSLDVLEEVESKTLRDEDLYRALTIGNSEHVKTRIYFEDDTHKLYVVETTVWGVTDKRIILKKGTIIPIGCIYRITF